MSKHSRRAYRKPDSDGGVSILEVVVAFAVLLLILVPISYILSNALHAASDAKNKVQALSIAEKWLEKLNSTGPPNNSHTLPTVGSVIQEGTSTFSGRKGTLSATIKYYPTAKFTWDTPTGAANLCASKKVPQVLALTVTVSWVGGSISDTTVTDFPPPGVPTYGFLGVQISGSPSSGTDPTPPASKGGVAWGGVGGRVATVPVHATSTGGTKYTTTAGTNGCAFMELPPGTYSVQVGPYAPIASAPFVATGSVTATSITDPTKATIAVSKVTTAGPFLYDEGAFVDVAYPNTTVTDGGVVCPNVAEFQCIATGQGELGTKVVAAASVLSGMNWSSLDIPITDGISQIESTSCSPSVCVSVGDGPAGAAAIIDIPSRIQVWGSSSPPAALNITNLSEVQCPTPTACLAVGSTASGPVIVGGAVTVSGGGTVTIAWTSDKFPSTVTMESITQITCSGATACLAIGTTATGPIILAGASTGATQTWVADTPTLNRSTPQPTMESLTQLTCSGTTACLAIGTTSTGPVVVAGPVSAIKQPWVQDTLPAAAKSLTQLTCSGTMACLAIGTTSTGDGIFAGHVSGTVGQTWVTDTVPTGSVLTDIVCPGTTECLSTGTNLTARAIVLSGAISATKESFTPDSLPGGTNPPVFLSGVACYHSTGLVCVTPGAGKIGAVLLTGTKPLAGSMAWAGQQPVTMASPHGPVSGIVAPDLPVSVGNTALPSGSFVACTGTRGNPCVSPGPLFPFTSGYSVGAGTCVADLKTAPRVATVPGTPAATFGAPVPLPLGLLPIEVVGSNGQPIAGAAVKATVADPRVPLNAPCNTLTLTMGSTGADGTVGVATIYETYKLSVTVGGTSKTVATVEVSPSSLTVTPPTGGGVVDYLPTPAKVVFP